MSENYPGVVVGYKPKGRQIDGGDESDAQPQSQPVTSGQTIRSPHAKPAKTACIKCRFLSEMLYPDAKYPVSWCKKRAKQVFWTALVNNCEKFEPAKRTSPTVVTPGDTPGASDADSDAPTLDSKE